MIWLGPELLKAGDYTLYGFSLAPIFAFSLRSLVFSCVAFILTCLPQWHLPHPITEISMPLKFPFQEECLAFDSSASSEFSSPKAKSHITANEEANF